MSPTILIVDDEPAIAQILATLMNDEGFAARTARDGQEALALLAQGGVDLMLSDVMMPRMDGRALLAELRRRGDRTPVVLMSAVRARDLEDMPFVAKPFDVDELLEVVRENLGAR